MRHPGVLLLAWAAALPAPALAADLCAAPCTITLDFARGGSITASGGATLDFAEGGALVLGEGGAIAPGEGGSVTPEGGDMAAGGSVVLGPGGSITFGTGGSLRASGFSVVDEGRLDIAGGDAGRVEGGGDVHFHTISARNVTLESAGHMAAPTAPFHFTMTEAADAGDFSAYAGGNMGIDTVYGRGEITATASGPGPDGGGGSSGGGSGSGSCVTTGDAPEGACDGIDSGGGGLVVTGPDYVPPASELGAEPAPAGSSGGGAPGLALLLGLALAALGRRVSRT